jgi:hypothetical protein
LILEDEEEVPTILAEGPILPANEPQSPVHRSLVFNRRNTPESSSTPPSTSSSEGQKRMRNLEELYDATQVIEDTTLFCFFADNDPLSFNEAVTLHFHKLKGISLLFFVNYSACIKVFLLRVNAIVMFSQSSPGLKLIHLYILEHSHSLKWKVLPVQEN